MSDYNHTLTAKFRQEGVHDWQEEQGDTDASMLSAMLDAQVEATLALVEEQRTANLIAYLASANREKLAYPVPLNVMQSMQAQIETRLGLS